MEKVYFPQYPSHADFPQWDIKANYSMLSPSSNSPTPDSDFIWIWHFHTLTKIKFFIWQCFSDLFPTNMCIYSLCITLNGYCLPFPNVLECSFHIFVDYCIAKSLWSQLGITFSFLSATSVHQWLSRIRDLKFSLPNTICQWSTFFPFALWKI